MKPPPLPKSPPPLPTSVAQGPPAESEALSNNILNIEELERFENLLIFAKAIVEGYFAGKHKSPNRGSAAEFADYKEYVPGDDLARMDWRVYGRTRRLYIRQFEEETDMVVYLLVDASGSMRYAGERRPTKFHLASRIAASLAYLMLTQGDKAALATFSENDHQRGAGRRNATPPPPNGARIGKDPTFPGHQSLRSAHAMRRDLQTARAARRHLGFPR
jgi:hypothetical protein